MIEFLKQGPQMEYVRVTFCRYNRLTKIQRNMFNPVLVIFFWMSKNVHLTLYPFMKPSGLEHRLEPDFARYRKMENKNFQDTWYSRSSYIGFSDDITKGNLQYVLVGLLLIILVSTHIIVVSI